MIGLFASGLALLLFGGWSLVRGATQLAQAARMSPLIIGLTVVALGTSTPEIAACVAAALRGQGDIAFGNVVGSNIFNVLLILGASAIIAPLVVAQRLLRVEVPIMISLSFAVLAFAGDEVVGRLEGLLLLVALVGYVVYSIRSAKAETPEVRSEYEREYASRRRRSGVGVAASLGLVVAGLGLLVWGSRWVVEGAVAVARALGISELTIGLTIVAAGTSLPEVVTSTLAAWKGERDIAVGNIVGSNIFNILGVLAVSALVAPEGIPTSHAALRFDVPVMIATSIACLPIFFTGHSIARWEGLVLLGYYVAYTAFLLLDAADHDALQPFSWIMLAFVLPLTVLTFAVVTVRSVRRRRSPNHPITP